MKVAVLFSGGKDSTRAAVKALDAGHEVVTLLTARPATDDSMMFHVPALEMAAAVAGALGLPHLYVEGGPEGNELCVIEKRLKELPIEGVVTGAVRSRYQKERIDAMCARLGIVSIAPFWGADPEAHMRALISEGYEIVFTGVAAEGLDEGWLGRRLDRAALDELLALKERYAINMEGEGGEYETLVLDGPRFRRRLRLLRARNAWDGKRGRLDIERWEFD